MKKNLPYLLASVFLSVHLYSVHTKLLYHLNPDAESIGYFSYQSLDENSITAMIFAVTYSAMTVIALFKAVNLMKFFWFTISFFALLDGLGIFVYYNVNRSESFFIMSALYYSIYTMFIIIALAYIKKYERSGQPKLTLEEKIMKLDEEGMKGNKIAKKLNTSTAKVSRTINKNQL